MDDPDTGEELIYWYCGDHIHDKGFCWGCGQFWGGVESFEFSPHGLCPNCQDDPDLTGRYEDLDDEYDVY
jgi:hypothetical protein